MEFCRQIEILNCCTEKDFYRQLSSSCQMEQNASLDYEELTDCKFALQRQRYRLLGRHM